MGEAAYARLRLGQFPNDMLPYAAIAIAVSPRAQYQPVGLLANESEFTTFASETNPSPNFVIASGRLSVNHERINPTSKGDGMLLFLGIFTILLPDHVLQHFVSGCSGRCRALVACFRNIAPLP